MRKVNIPPASEIVETLWNKSATWSHTKFKIDKNYLISYPNSARNGWVQSRAKVLWAPELDLSTYTFIPPKRCNIIGKKHYVEFIFEDMTATSDYAQVGFIYKPGMDYLKRIEETIGWRVIIWKDNQGTWTWAL